MHSPKNASRCLSAFDENIQRKGRQETNTQTQVHARAKVQTQAQARTRGRQHAQQGTTAANVSLQPINCPEQSVETNKNALAHAWQTETETHKFEEPRTEKQKAAIPLCKRPNRSERQQQGAYDGTFLPLSFSQKNKHT